MDKEQVQYRIQRVRDQAPIASTYAKDKEAAFGLACHLLELLVIKDWPTPSLTDTEDNDG